MTHLDFAILGLISQNPSTGYEVRKAFETTALGNYSSSPGSIYPALERLRKQNMVTQNENDSGRKLFHITEHGARPLYEWLSTPVEKRDLAKNLDIVLLRFAFMEDLLTHEETVIFLESFRDELNKYNKELEEFHRAEGGNMKMHGRLAFEHGIESYRTTLRWVRKTLKSIQ